MKILVTGVCGLVGGRVALHLLGQGHQVFGIGRSKCENIDVQLLPTCVFMDLSSKEAVEKIKEKIPSSIDMVIHCAAQQPRADLLLSQYLEGNVYTTENIVEWARGTNVRTIISFSTLAFLDFPLEDGIKVTELTNPAPKNYYALSKWVSESFMKLSTSSDCDFSVLCFRIPSLVHEGQKDGLVHTYWEASIKDIDLSVYDNGQFRRNLIYINSILEVVDLVLAKVDTYNGFQLYNIGSKDSWTMAEIARYMYSQAGATAKISPVNKTSSIHGHWNVDVSKAENELGFSPWYTKDILDAYIQNIQGGIE